MGDVDTQVATRSTAGVMQASGEVASVAMMGMEHIAQAVVYMASPLLDAKFLFLTVVATKMPFVGRTHQGQENGQEGPWQPRQCVQRAQANPEGNGRNTQSGAVSVDAFLVVDGLASRVGFLSCGPGVRVSDRV